MFDVEHFIDVVKKYPLIWDFSKSNGCNVSTKAQIWYEIASQVFEGWETFHNTLRGEKVTILKSKWKNIRDHYRKSVIAQNSGKPSSYRYAKRLTFLNENFMQPRLKQKKSKNSNNVSTNMRFPVLANELEPIHSTNDHHSHYNIKFDLNDSMFSACDEASTSRTPQSQFASAGKDNDFDFVMSLLPEYKRLTPALKLEFKIHTYEFFRKIYK